MGAINTVEVGLRTRHGAHDYWDEPAETMPRDALAALQPAALEAAVTAA